MKGQRNNRSGTIALCDLWRQRLSFKPEIQAHFGGLGAWVVWDPPWADVQN